MKNKIFILLTFLIFSISGMYAQTTLKTGDIAFVGLNSDGNDDFSFILLTDISSGTILNIADYGWNDDTGFYMSTGDGKLVWTATSALTAGTVIHIKTTDNGTMSTTSFSASVGSIGAKSFPWDFNISYTGDQLFIYQGTDADPIFIAGIHWNVETGITSNINWDKTSSSNATSALPDQLTNGVNAVWVCASDMTEFDNFIFNGSTISGNCTTLLAEINNINNWNTDLTGTTAFTQYPFPILFTVLCNQPDVPNVTPNLNSVCSGNTITISMSGNLNDAEAWYIYTESCGGTSLGSTVTNSYTVSPETTTTYYIRGEGGCTTSELCGSTTISINPSTTITSEPNANSIACEGDAAIVLSLTASGAGTIEYQWYNSKGIIDGANSSSYSVTTSSSNSDTYYCIVTGDCGSKTSNNAIVTIHPVYNLNETASVCSGDSYTFPDGTTQNNITEQVEYTSNLQSAITGCDSIIVTTVTVNTVYNLNETASVCSGDSYTFPDGTTQNNITEQVIYTSNLQSAITGCDSIIVTTVTVNPVYNQNETASVCSGDSYTFPDGTTKENITAQFAYTSNLQSEVTGCDSIITTTVTVIPINKELVIVENAIKSVETNATFKLLDCANNYAVKEEANLEVYPITQNGSYALEITKDNSIEISDCYTFSNVGLETILQNSIKIFPNPTKGKITIDLGTHFNTITVTLLNSIGQTISSKTVFNTSKIDYQIDGTNGTYFIQLSDDNEFFTTIMVIKE